MGTALANGSGSKQSVSEWSTPPLWGLDLALRIGKTPRYLHDGRASGLQTAVLWHGGEAERFVSLDASGRSVLLAFLRSL